MFDPNENFKPYRNPALVKKGALGEVYLAQTEAGEKVAIKRLHPYLAYDKPKMNGFLREAAILKKIRHPRVVRLIEARLEDPENSILVLEWLEGKGFGDYFREYQNLKEREVAALLFLKSLLSTLEFFQELAPEPGASPGLIHGDLSPNNILIDLRGDVQIIDFTCSSWVTEEKNYSGGTWGYMPLLQIENGPVHLGADLFAAGLLFAEALTGKRLLEGQTTFTIFKSLYELKPEETAKKVTSNPCFQNILRELLDVIRIPFENPTKNILNELRELPLQSTG